MSRKRGFILPTISAVLMGIVVSMNVYIVKHSGNLKVTIGSLFSGSTLSMISSTCASCSSVGFLLVSTFGGAGVTASAFLSNYQIPLRIISVFLLMWALYSASSKLNSSIMIQPKFEKLLLALHTYVDKEGRVDKTAMTHSDVFDTCRMALEAYTFS